MQEEIDVQPWNEDMNKRPGRQVGPVWPRMNRRPLAQINSPGVESIGRIILGNKGHGVVQELSYSYLPEKIKIESDDDCHKAAEKAGLLLKQQTPRFAVVPPFPQQEQTKTESPQHHGLAETCG